jgi:hypothetical protein
MTSAVLVSLCLSDEVLRGLGFVAAFFFVGSFFVSIVSLLSLSKIKQKHLACCAPPEKHLLVKGLVAEVVSFDVSG